MRGLPAPTRPVHPLPPSHRQPLHLRLSNLPYKMSIRAKSDRNFCLLGGSAIQTLCTLGNCAPQTLRILRSCDLLHLGGLRFSNLLHSRGLHTLDSLPEGGGVRRFLGPKLGSMLLRRAFGVKTIFANSIYNYTSNDNRRMTNR